MTKRKISINWDRVVIIWFWLTIIFLLLFISKFGSRILVGDWFPVNTGSMTPTIIPGDKIWVNKLIFGARVYKNLDFLKGEPLETFRVKGWRKIDQGDVVVFNGPIPDTKVDSVFFKIDYVLVKRCKGVPGDTVYTYDFSKQLSSRDSLRISRQKFSGVVYVPKKGDTIYMNNPHIARYRLIIKYETKGIVPTDYHIFLNNYYFMCGDNIPYSYDSRNFGFVPEEFIIGVSRRALFNNRDGWKQRYSGRRVMKRLG
jgi:signal peptidase I